MSDLKQKIICALDGMALKIVMIEPGDLSVVGEVLGLLEELLKGETCSEYQQLFGMGSVVKKVFEKIIMAELADSSDNYETLGECITIMQEVARNDGEVDDFTVQKFCEKINKTGFSVEGKDLAVSSPVTLQEESARQTEDDRFEFLKDKEMLNSFIEESVEHLENIEVSIIDLEKSPEDPEAVNKIFRSFHTMKGIANCLNLHNISNLAHATENLLDEVRSRKRRMDASLIDVVLSVGDNLRAMVQNIQQVSEEGRVHYIDFDVSEELDKLRMLKEDDVSSEKKNPSSVDQGEPNDGNTTAKDTKNTEGEVVDSPVSEADAIEEKPVSAETIPDFLQDKDLLSGFVEESAEHLETIEVNVLELEQSPDDLDIINNIFRPFHTIKGVSGFLNLKTINKLAHTTENLLDDVRNGVRPMNAEIIEIVLNVGDCLKNMIENIKEVLENGPECYKEIDINGYVQKINAIQNGSQAPAAEAASVGEQPHQENKRQEPSPLPGEESAKTVNVSTVKEAGQQAPAPQAGGATKIGASIKVGVEKLDALVNAVGELVIMQSLVQENQLIRRISDPKLTRDFSQLTRITSELQKTAMSMRMVPIRQTFQKMIRLVRDLSKKSNKQVDLIMEGEETEIDRNMVDSIYDPLVHMIRNSVDHGVQIPAEREKNGKPGTGTVCLRAYQKGGNMVIEIEDDGEGLNTEKIRRKAVERGLISDDDNLSAYELNNMIFVPGFSTADKITDVSGRGVGMDVVKKAVEKLRGKVEANSTPGKGSQFIIKLPLTLAIIDGIIVRVGSERYIIPTIAIKESLKPIQESYKTVYGRGEAVMLRDHLIPIIRLYDVFDVDPTYTDPCEAILVVVESEGSQRALMVDELLGKQEVVIKNLGGLTDIEGVAGGTILGDGRVGLILDLAGLIDGSGSTVSGSETQAESSATAEFDDF